jgi:localization factor PodJL
MQPDLPWNVAGIPSEAREAARASARREGLSVGEWLTRRILNALAEGEPAAQTWRSEAASARESEEMLSHVSRSESEAQNAYRRIEDQLRVLARRLDATERSQSENGRAMSKAATEISIASREQAQAFDQLGSHVVNLSERLKRVEGHTANDGVRDAVKALHQGLTRLADQIATTANQSASQIAAVAGNVESVAGKLSQARLESENTSHALDQRLRSIEESEAFAEVRKKLEELGIRLDSHETETSAAIARLEEKLDAVEERTTRANLDSRVQAVEHAMTDAGARLDHVDRRSAANAVWEETLRTLNVRLDESEKRQRETAVELQAAIKEMLNRHAASTPQPAQPSTLEAHAPEPPPVFAPPPPFSPQPQMAAPVADFDMPPFPDQPQQQAEPVAEPFNIPPPPPFDTGFAPEPAASNESYLSAARRSAREAAAAQAEAHPGFNWGFSRPQGESEAPKTSRARYFLIGGIVAIAALALIAGLMLNRNQHRIIVPQNIGAAFSKLKPAPLKPAPAIKPSTAEAPVKQVEVKPATAKPVAATPAPVKAARAAAPKPVTPADHLAALANGGNASAELLLGLKYLNGDGTPVNEAEAARWFERAAAQGDAIAEYRLGTLYERGRGVPADARKATDWYAAAAKQGNRKAMHNLAVAYAQGSGVKKDYALAAQWFSKAANLGLADSQFNLAVLYERGMGVPQSLLDAYKWYAVAASQGDTESRSRIDALATQISPDDRAAAQHSADTFKPAPLNAAANTPPDISTLPPA